LPEIVFSTYFGQRNIVALNAEDGSLLWKYITGACNDAAPIIYDVDNDGNQEVILAVSSDFFIYCLDGKTGELKWKTPAHGTDSPPTIADINGDGIPEIIDGQFWGWLMCLRGTDGKLLWEIQVDTNCCIQTEPALVDLNNDGQLDIVVGIWSYSAKNWLYAVDGKTHTIMWKFDLPKNYIYHGPAFADIDRDGKPELVFGSYDGHVYAVNGEDGSLLWDFSKPDSYYVGAPVSMADLNKDGKYEIVTVDYYTVTVLSNEGKKFWDYKIKDFSTAFRGAAISDVNGDGKPDVVFGTTSGKLIALNGGDGSETFNYDLSEKYGKSLELGNCPIISDFNKDGFHEIFVVGGHTDTTDNYSHNYGIGYMIETNHGAGTDWAMFRRDRFRSATVPVDTLSSVNNDNEEIEKEFVVLYDPTNKSAVIKPNHNKNSIIRIELFDILGKTIKYWDNASGNQNDIIQLPLEDAPSGLYFIKILTDEGNQISDIIIN
jgi:outer membrane protein assembly factor BamB